ncbi:hypothetical protein PHYPSEUDO_013034 [Phytophthora pseudosyringae]|uniref:Elicitin n=1 Tax=Phytophthora pseudosyringae TaxID=221518 RepID=A0A8T1V6H0_9STRA|nr:hypothetical protein PHYPSEUDO_013034 [Phytophthora pseudosyringae]
MRTPVSTLLLLSLALLASASNAAECTDSEATYAVSLWDSAAVTSACAQYAVTSNPVYIDAPCTATDCVSVMEGVAESLPSCTFSGVSNKIELQNALTVCNGDDTDDAGSPTTVTEDTGSPTTVTDAPMSSSTTDCTTAEYQSTEDLYDAAATTSECSRYSTSSSLLVTFDMPCSATDCISVLVQLAADLPDCLYDGANQKTELTDNLGVCTDDAEAEVDSSTPVATTGDTTDTTSSSSPTPASTASSTGCTTTETNDMWDLYVSTATSDECAADSTVNGYSVYIFTSCDSECANKVKSLAEALPNCYYDYEFMNKKQDVLEELDGCEESFSYYISVTIYPDSMVDTSSVSSSASSSESDTGPLVSGAIAFSSTLQVDVADAAECTDSEWQTSQSIWSWAATTAACAQYAIGGIYVSAPCTARSCVAVMEQVGEQLPDCTASGVNNKIEVQNAMTVCNGEDLVETDAPLVSPPTAAPLVTVAPIATSAPFQTSAPLPSLAPRPSGGDSGASEAAAATTAPSSTDGSSDWSFGSSSTSSTPSPAATSSTTSCTTAQVSSLVSLYSEAAKSASCAPDATFSSYSVYIFTKCASSCASKLEILAGDIPNCYYDYESSNKKASLLEQIDGCTGTSHASSISTTVYLSTTSATSRALSRALHLSQTFGLVLFAVAGILL